MYLLWNGIIPEFFCFRRGCGGSLCARAPPDDHALNTWFRAFFVFRRQVMKDTDYMRQALELVLPSEKGKDEW